MANLNLDSVERRHSAVQKVLAYYEERIVELLDKLEKSADVATTEKIRGRIAEIREFQSEFKERPDIRPVSADHR